MVDWNFNLTFVDNADVLALPALYKDAIDHPDFYAPIPPEWLHVTVLRVGFTTEYSEADMLQLSEAIVRDLQNLTLPVFEIGNPILMHGSTPVLCFIPEDKLSVLRTIVGKHADRIFGHEKVVESTRGIIDTVFKPHLSLAYPKTTEKEDEIWSQIQSYPVPLKNIRVTSMSLVKQIPINGHYEWEVVKKIPLGLA